ncbi:hypothetical protein ACB092_06G194200 [Castanea dentata]
MHEEDLSSHSHQTAGETTSLPCIHKLVTNTYKVTNPSSSKHVKAHTSVFWPILNAINAYRPAYVLKFKISQFLSAIMSLCPKKNVQL